MPFPANDVETALSRLRAGQGSPDELLAALADGELWLSLPAGAPADDEIQLPIVAMDGHPLVVVYTSAEQYARGAGEGTHAVMRGRDLADRLPAELGLAVNPGGEYGLPIRPVGVRAMSGGAHTLRAGQQVRLGLPAEEPEELLAALAERLRAVPAVASARRAWMQVGDEPPGLLIGVALDPATDPDRERTLAAVRDAVAAVPVDYAVDTIFLDNPADTVQGWLLDNTQPCHER
ncbi:enhanced serine sensitivity protein SseB C-terminal domain-containing protein [Micromonospora sp. DT47]|uniref:enhanced serine sensitivity protein SseB C-terminal domain-containing protein n=1 Tax=Micromonospora sp. DT47 TaxID=3393431 RepID=UPI003CEFB6BF